MAVADLKTPAYPITKFSNPNPPFVSSSSRLSFRHLPQSPAPLIRCSVTSDQIQAPVGVDANDPPECFGVFCLTYDLKAEEETKSWKKMINAAVSGAAGMISN